VGSKDIEKEKRHLREKQEQRRLACPQTLRTASAHILAQPSAHIPLRIHGELEVQREGSSEKEESRNMLETCEWRQKDSGRLREHPTIEKFDREMWREGADKEKERSAGKQSEGHRDS
jgi:DNA/RNA-binding domain of Phe-tRNA-synthetase-like protein